MRLYRTKAGSWHGTQRDAEAASRAEGAPGTWETVEVPTDKPGLLDWLNAQGRPQGRDEAREAPEAPVAPTSPPVASTIDDRAAQATQECDVEEAIGRADLPRTIRLAEHIHWRLKEHLEEARLYLTPR